jgi:hypothetical protein
MHIEHWNKFGCSLYSISPFFLQVYMVFSFSIISSTLIDEKH